MTYLFLGGIALLLAAAAWPYVKRLSPARFNRSLRWLVGGGAALLALLLFLARQTGIAVFVAAAAVSVLRTGRLGPFSLDRAQPTDGNVSRVKSRYFAMTLDHDTGAVEGRVVAGRFAGQDLMALGEMDTRALFAEIDGDPDSVGLLESWLDANRQGWREYFAQTATDEPAAESMAGADPHAEAYAILGLEPGADDEQIRAAHRELMKGVHPDHGGSSYLAAKINAARDLLLKT